MHNTRLGSQTQRPKPWSCCLVQQSQRLLFAYTCTPDQSPSVHPYFPVSVLPSFLNSLSCIKTLPSFQNKPTGAYDHSPTISSNALTLLTYLCLEHQQAPVHKKKYAQGGIKKANFFVIRKLYCLSAKGLCCVPPLLWASANLLQM